MHMKLDDIELIKREEKDGTVNEIRSIHALSVYGRRRIVELPIPGSVGVGQHNITAVCTACTIDLTYFSPAL